MRVFEINTVCGTGSTGRIAVDLAHMLKEHGDECCIAYSRGDAPEDVDTFRFGNKAEIYWHGIMTRLSDRHGMYSKGATRELIRRIQEYQPDVIHLHNIHGYYLNIEILFDFLREYHRPVVWTLHDCWTYTGHCSHYTCVECEKWKSGCYDCPLKREYPGSMFADRSTENYRMKKRLFTSLEKLHLVTPSDWLKKEVEKSFFKGIPCTAIPNGIEIEKFIHKKSDLRDRLEIHNKRVILGVANVWTEQKGIGDFIELSKILNESYQLVMVGVDQKRRKLLPSNIIALEKTKNIEELIELYSMSDIYFNSSIEETMGMTTGEAICCGTPVVAYRSTAIPESVGAGCGIILEPHDIEGVARAFDEILNSKEQYEQACHAYRNRFDKKVSNDMYYQVYCKMINSKGNDK